MNVCAENTQDGDKTMNQVVCQNGGQVGEAVSGNQVLTEPSGKVKIKRVKSKEIQELEDAVSSELHAAYDKASDATTPPNPKAGLIAIANYIHEKEKTMKYVLRFLRRQQKWMIGFVAFCAETAPDRPVKRKPKAKAGKKVVA